MRKIEKDFLDRLKEGLLRKSLTIPSRWAEHVRVLRDGAWSFERYPWLREMHDSVCELNIGQKGAQLGYTELALNIAFFMNDIKQKDVLYVLPSQNPHASDFSNGRFDPAIELSPHLKSIYSDVRNVGLKRAGLASLYVRGSNSRAGLKSVPVAAIVVDEMEEMDQDNIPLVLERTSGQLEKLVWMISTPTIFNHGINRYFKLSSQEHFFFACPRCGKQIELKFPESLEIIGDDPESTRVHESYLKCYECQGRLEHKDKVNFLRNAKWVPSVTNVNSRGFHVSQLYSTTISPGALAISFLRGKTSPADEQEFYNSKLGLPFEPYGSRISDEMIDSCIGDYKQSNVRLSGKLVTMGIDVGKRNHYEIVEWDVGDNIGHDINHTSRGRVVACGAVHKFIELDRLMEQFNVSQCVIDAQPERRAAYDFSQRHFGRVRMCYYNTSIGGRQLKFSESDIGEPVVHADRTSWLDMSLGRIRNATISLPNDLPFEYRDHMRSVVRIFVKDALGQQVSKYIVIDNKEDHHVHSRNYAEIALAIAAHGAESQTIGDVL